jgi:hypothetical protein
MVKQGIDPNKPEDLKNFCEHRDPDGTRPMAWHANAATYLYSLLYTAAPSINGWLKTQPKEVFDRFVKEVFKPAVMNAVLVMNEACVVRRRENGQHIKEKAALVGFIAAHLTAADGNTSLHAHVPLWRYGTTQDGRALSFHDGRFLFGEAFKKSVEVFHQSLAVGLFQHFGIKAEVKDGKCEIPGVPKEVLETLGTRSKAARAWLEKQGISETDQSMQIAVWQTRPKGVPHFDLTERFAHWNQEARQALGAKADQYMRPATGTGAATTERPTQSETRRSSESNQTAVHSSTAGPEQSTAQADQRQKGGEKTEQQQSRSSQQQQHESEGFRYFRQTPGRKQSPTGSLMSRALKDLIGETGTELAKTAMLVARKAFVPRDDVIQVKNLARANEDGRTPTKGEVFRAVRNELRRKNVDDWNAIATLGRLTGIALKVYLKARKPKVSYPPGTVMVVSRKAQRTATPEQKKQFARLAAKRGWAVRYAKLEQDQSQQQGQQQGQKQQKQQQSP